MCGMKGESLTATVALLGNVRRDAYLGKEGPQPALPASTRINERVYDFVIRSPTITADYRWYREFDESSFQRKTTVTAMRARCARNGQQDGECGSTATDAAGSIRSPESSDYPRTTRRRGSKK